MSAAPQEGAGAPSLSSRLLRHLMLPLALTWAVGAGVAILVGDSFTEQAFDGALLDDAFVIGSHVRSDAQGMSLDLTRDELDAVLFDQSETMYFAVLREDGSLLAGQAGLEPATVPASSANHAFSTIDREGNSLRAVRLRHREAPVFSVIIAQTTRNRSQLLRRLLVYSIVPQLLLLLLLAWRLRRVIRDDLAPLTALQHTLDRRDASDLSPLPPSLARNANSREVERLGLAINALLGRVGDGVRAQREFAGNVAHELRTPLAGIRALAEYGLTQTQPQALREQLQAIVDSQARASRLVDQLLALALADETRGSLQLESVALGAVTRDVVLRFMPRADQAGVDLGAHGLEQALTVSANTALVEGMLGNLIDNALRHGRNAKGDAPVVTVELVHHEDGVSLSVIDNGPGLTASERQSLLQRWAQGERGERLGDGAGLGLAIVSRYAELLQARFELAEGPRHEGLRASVVFAKPTG